MVALSVHSRAGGTTRRKSAAAATVAAAGMVWPLISQMNPDASTRALASTEVDISAIPLGQIVTVKWRGKPVFVRHRTPEEIKAAEAIRAARREGY